MLAAQGAAAFVFHRPGTGASGGSYTQRFSRLAEDIVAKFTQDTARGWKTTTELAPV